MHYQQHCHTLLLRASQIRIKTHTFYCEPTAADLCSVCFALLLGISCRYHNLDTFFQYQPGTSCCHILLLLLGHATQLTNYSSPTTLQMSYVALLAAQADADVAVSCFAQLVLAGSVSVGLCGLAMHDASSSSSSSGSSSGSGNVFGGILTALQQLLHVTATSSSSSRPACMPVAAAARAVSILQSGPVVAAATVAAAAAAASQPPAGNNVNSTVDDGGALPSQPTAGSASSNPAVCKEEPSASTTEAVSPLLAEEDVSQRQPAVSQKRQQRLLGQTNMWPWQQHQQQLGQKGWQQLLAPRPLWTRLPGAKHSTSNTVAVTGPVTNTSSTSTVDLVGHQQQQQQQLGCGLPSYNERSSYLSRFAQESADVGVTTGSCNTLQQQQQQQQKQGYVQHLDMTDMADILAHFDGYITSDGHLIFTSCCDHGSSNWMSSSSGIGLPFYKTHAAGVHWVGGWRNSSSSSSGTVAAAADTGNADSCEQQQQSSGVAADTAAVFAALEAAAAAAAAAPPSAGRPSTQMHTANSAAAISSIPSYLQLQHDFTDGPQQSPPPSIISATNSATASSACDHQYDIQRQQATAIQQSEQFGQPPALAMHAIAGKVLLAAAAAAAATVCCAAAVGSAALPGAAAAAAIGAAAGAAAARSITAAAAAAAAGDLLQDIPLADATASSSELVAAAAAAAAAANRLAGDYIQQGPLAKPLAAEADAITDAKFPLAAAAGAAPAAADQAAAAAAAADQAAAALHNRRAASQSPDVLQLPPSSLRLSAVAVAAAVTGVSEIILHRSGYHFTLSIINHQHRTVLHFDSLGASSNHAGFARIQTISSKTWKDMVDPAAAAAAVAAGRGAAAAVNPWGAYTAVPLPAAAVQRGGLNTCGPHAMFAALSYVADASGFRSSCGCIQGLNDAAGANTAQQQRQQQRQNAKVAAVQGALQQCYQQGLQSSSTHDVDLLVSRAYGAVAAAAAAAGSGIAAAPSPVRAD
jgi:hypothetical protein